MYSYIIHSGIDEHKRCKGMRRQVVSKSISHENCKHCLFSGEEVFKSINLVGSDKHNIYTEQVNKICLSGADDKRVILPDGIYTLAYGHWRIKHLEDN